MHMPTNNSIVIIGRIVRSLHLFKSCVSSQQSVGSIKTHQQSTILLMDGCHITRPKLHPESKTALKWKALLLNKYVAHLCCGRGMEPLGS